MKQGWEYVRLIELQTQNDGLSSGRGLKLGILFGAVLILIGVWIVMPGINWETVLHQEHWLRMQAEERPSATYAGAFLFYLVIATLSIPGTWIVSMLLGWLLGFWPALVLINLASTAGATINFLLSRYFFRESVRRRLGKYWEPFRQSFAREGGKYLFSLRLIPGIPFVMVNSLMGLTEMRVRDYWWITQVGMLPGTAAFVWAGNSVPELRELSEQGLGLIWNWQLGGALITLAILPWIGQRLMVFFSR